MNTSSGLRVGGAFRLPLVLAAMLAMATLLAGYPGAKAAQFYRVHTGEKDVATVMMRGQIDEGDLARLQRVIAKIESGQRIVLMLESEGGRIDEGIAIGRYVYTSKITTVAIQGTGCHSSCTYIFLAGRGPDERPLRIMMKGARVGFHQGSLGNLPKDRSFSGSDIEAATEIGQNIIKKINSYFNDIKADPEFLTLVLSASRSSITLLNEFDALRLGIYVMDTSTQKLITPADFKK